MNLFTKDNDDQLPQPEVQLYTDGACSGNPGVGGWAFILIHLPSGQTLEDFGSEDQTTNNRMELRAVIEGLKRLKRRTRVHIVTDSNYVHEGITKWIHSWKRAGWRRKTRGGWEPVKNEELWRELDERVRRHDVSFEWVRGHAGDLYNERCDELAVAAYRRKLPSRKKGGC